MTPEQQRRRCKSYHVRRYQMGGATTVPADDAAETLQHLAARMSHTAIARALNTSHSYVGKVIRGEVKRIAPARAAAIARLAGHQPDGTHHVSPIGATRRLRALHALGHTWKSIAEHVEGYSLTSIKHLAHGHIPEIEADHDAAIRAAYEALAMTLPTSDNPYKRGAISAARSNAASRGWLPPLAWDNIDDPHEKPSRSDPWRQSDVDHAVIARVLAGEKRPRQLTHAECAEIVRRCDARGMSGNQIEAMYGIKPDRYRKVGDAA